MITIQKPRGTISITNEVFRNIAGDAATRCFGVKGMAGRSKTDGLVHLLRREVMSKGVFVSMTDENTVVIDLHIVVDHGVSISALSESIMSEVRYKVSKATGVEVSRVDIYVDSMVRD